MGPPSSCSPSRASQSLQWGGGDGEWPWASLQQQPQSSLGRASSSVGSEGLLWPGDSPVNPPVFLPSHRLQALLPGRQIFFHPKRQLA